MTESKNQSGYEPDEITVTPEMVDAGLRELRSHSFSEDAALVIEAIYRAMVYAR